MSAHCPDCGAPKIMCGCREAPTGPAGIVIKRATDTKPRAKQFLVPGWWPMKALCLLVGRENGGKSLYMVWLIAQITKGAYGKPRRVLILGAEDEWEEEWLPRLVAAGAALDMIGYDASYSRETDDGPVLDPLHLGRPEVQDELADAMKTEGYDVLILDHLDIALPTGSRSKDYEDMGRALRRLNQWAKKNCFAVAAGWHMSKGAGPTQDKTIGSVAIRSSVRVLWMLAENPDDNLRYVALEKANGMDLNRKAVSFSVVGTTIPGGIHTVVASGVADADHPGTGKEFVAQLIERQSQPPKPRDEEGKDVSASEWLAALLSDGPKMRQFVLKLAEQSGFSESAVEKAFRNLGAVSVRHGKQVAWSTSATTTSSVPGGIQGSTDVTDVDSTSATSVTSVTNRRNRTALNTPPQKEVKKPKRQRRTPTTGTDSPTGTPVDLDALAERLNQ